RRCDRDHGDMPRHDHAGIDPEVDRTGVDPRDVARVQRLLQPCLLIRRHREAARHALGGALVLCLRLIAGIGTGRHAPALLRALTLVRGITWPRVGARGRALTRAMPLLALRRRLIAALLGCLGTWPLPVLRPLSGLADLV